MTEARAQTKASFLRKHFPLDIVVVPTLSPLEQNEELVNPETVERNRYSRLASRNFRNFWLNRTSKEFEEFAELVEFGWPGLKLRFPETQQTDTKPVVRMYFRDGPHVREVQWAGFGFQVWMQTMTHLLKANKGSVLVLDEPDIYLHPDLQHRLLDVVSRRVGQYFIATHSTEIINKVDPGDVLILRPGARSAKRIRTEGDFSAVYDAIGSSENAQFARLARTKKVLYFEGHDNRLLAKLGRLVSGEDYLSDASVTLMKTDGFSNWSRVSTSAWVFNQFFEFDVKVASLFDRDYRCDADVADFVSMMKDSDVLCHVLPVKEIENILLVPEAIIKVVKKHSKKTLAADWENEILKIFSDTISGFKDPVFSRIVGKYIEYELGRNPKQDVTTLSANEADRFSQAWNTETFRRAKVPGKAAFSLIAKDIQDKFGVSLTPSRVVDELELSQIHPDIRDLLNSFKSYFAE
ncbi:ATP-dependent nuclease [Rhizobium jaguaris]|uniref:ATP-dependent nuclease n=1 Tax=Rhizobium jaguaris TaxID=1312183 RepID=UPI001FE05906|nr:AAA family ATPase [Rhizobium jaguaris]